jgi:activator of HSP90 ATPase
MLTTIVDRRSLSRFGGIALIGALSAPDSAESAAKLSAPRNDTQISHDNAAIRQHVELRASPSRVYEALTVASEFDKVTRLSAAMNSSMKAMLGTAITLIDARPGGAFSLFGGFVSGFNLELRKSVLIVQAWRSRSWEAGFYSIARMQLFQRGNGTTLLFDHAGFPNSAACHLAEGWHMNYWKPLARMLG